MKKYYLLILSIFCFIGVNSVRAEEYYTINNFYHYFGEHLEAYNQHKDSVNQLITYWQENYSQEYPYYIVVSQLENPSTSQPVYYLYASKHNVVSQQLEYFTIKKLNNSVIRCSYVSETNNFAYNDLGYDPITIFYSNPTIGSSYHYDKYIPLISNGFVYDNSGEFGSLYIPPYTSESLSYNFPEIHIGNNDSIPTLLSLYNGEYFPEDTLNFTTINLNNYSYVALSLKDYTKRDTFYSNFYVKGNFCITPVYNYGMTEKKDVIDGSKNQRCSSYYETSTLVRTYVLEQDISNNAIYYVKAYDTSKPNEIMVDNTIFDITYITEEEKDSPYVNISGKNYPTIAYDKLTDSATISEKEDYISGVSCPVGDFNCYNEYNPNNIFDDLFDKPLEMLKTIWNSILTIFNLITQFILLLPPVMQGFLYLAFGIAIILGIIKIIL